MKTGWWLTDSSEGLARDVQHCWFDHYMSLLATVCLCSRAGMIFLYIDISQYSLAWYDIDTVCSVIDMAGQGSCMFLLCMLRTIGVVWTLSASWLCTMAANAGANENRIVPNKTQRARFGPIWDSHVMWMGQWTTSLEPKLPFWILSRSFFSKAVRQIRNGKPGFEASEQP